jgi:prepilin-type N-terminal cleavage/methylation domain-containing protein
MKQRENQRGFTLLELLLSMTLTALLLGMLSAGVYAVVNDWRRETSVLDATLDKALVVLQLERALQAAFPHSYIDTERLRRAIYFQGTEDSLTFISAVSPQRQPGLTAWRLQPASNGGLQLLLTPAYSDNPEERLAELEPSPLRAGYQARFRYLVQRNPQEKEWLDAWDGSQMQSLPHAVHVVLTPRASQGAPADVLEFIAPIRAWQHFEIEPTIPVLP